MTLPSAVLLTIVSCNKVDHFPEPDIEVGDACRHTQECKNPEPDAYTVCHEGICTLRSDVISEREKQTASKSLEAAPVPTGETLAEGWFTRIRMVEGKGVAVAQCGPNEWLTGGSCSPTSGGGEITPRAGPDGSGRGGSWRCAVDSLQSRVVAHAICATQRESAAERAPGKEPAR